MTQYEKLSLAFLSIIAQGIGQLNERLDVMFMQKAGLSADDLLVLLGKQRESLGSWLQELGRLDRLARRNPPDEDGLGTNGTSG